ncbi:CsbD family protein [Ramlibacter sp. AW1]|uniref:CsbD family protein n=1 Tax=Ramlibacter aurantiacus TaxID=2801330 RepID=A0A936ZKN1_9BURK|nr:CsbD family protein [Ramlibacter aurantiacus]MBL0421562.1 CsbD family protein [Ramlibacter aurantiacus]
MNKDQVKGGIKEAAGKAQKNLGDAMDSHEQEAKGAAKEAEGKVQKNVGHAKEDVREATNPSPADKRSH